MITPRPIAMITSANRTLMLHYNGKSHVFTSDTPIGETAVEHRGNAICIYWKYSYDSATDPYRAAFEIAIDDIGLNGATVHPVKDLHDDNLQDDLC